MRILITGSHGFIGTVLTKKLIELKHEVIGLDDLSTGKYQDLGCEFVQKSILDTIEVIKASRNCDAIIHLAAKTSVQESNNQEYLYNETNIKGTLNVLSSCEMNKVPKFIFASSAAIYKPTSVYAVTKIAGENYCEVYRNLYGMNTICLRFFNIYGQGQNPNYSGVIPKFITSLKNKQPLIIYGDGNQVRDFVYIDDVVNSIILALDYDGSGTFDVGSGESRSVIDLSILCSTIFNKHYNVIFKPALQGELRDSYSNIKQTTLKLGYKPKVSLKQGLKYLLKSY